MSQSTNNLSELLRYLKQNEGVFVSGAELTERFAISRTGIWKHIQKLKSMGYDILSHPKEGYKLMEVPDSLAGEEIVPNIETAWMGRSYHYLEKTESTNDYALQLASRGAPHGTVIVAEEQTRGRGRLRREWLSTAKRGIYMSILLTNPLPVNIAPQTTYVAALALAKVLRAEYGLPASLKWPNDILIGGRKTAGILTEMQSDQDLSRFIVIGIGVNVNHSREEMAGPFRYPATSVSIEAGRPIKRQHLLLAFIRRFESDYDSFVEYGFKKILPELENMSAIFGKQITIICGDREVTGKARGFSPEGALLLDGNDGAQEIIWAGDVTRVEGAA